MKDIIKWNVILACVLMYYLVLLGAIVMGLSFLVYLFE